MSSQGRATLFTSVGLQFIALVVAFCDVRAQSAAAAGAVATGRGTHASTTFVAGTTQLPSLTETSPSTDQRGSGFFTSPAAQIEGVLTAPGQSYIAPGDALGVFSGPAITGNDLFSPFVDIFRSNLLGDPKGSPSLGAVGGTLDTRGANHFEASLGPHWVFYRNSRYPITVTLPVQVMAADDPYYFGHHYGWMSGGVNVRVPLSFIPKQFGKWSAGTSADLCYYGTTTSEFASSLGLQVPRLGAALSLGF